MKSNWAITVISCFMLLSACGTANKAAKSSSADIQTTALQQDKADNSKIRENVALTTSTQISDNDILKPSRHSKSAELPDSIIKIQKQLVKIAKSKLGCHYRYGGKGPNSFDCSGFTGYVFKQAGIVLGASSRDQYRQGRALTESDELLTGDLVFWKSRRSGSLVGHVGMVVDYDRRSGEFTFIHASNSSGIEIQKSSAQYYVKYYVGARRILGEPDIVSTAPAVSDLTTSGDETKTESESVPETIYHTIKSGDTLYALALKYHTRVDKICSLNGISENKILQIGQKLRIK